MKAMRLFWVRVKGFVGCFKPRPVQPGGHSTIPWGKIIAKPRSDGGYSLLVYHGIQIGWVRAGEVAPGENVQAAMRNLARPVETLVPNDEEKLKELEKAEEILLKETDIFD